jgi:hypothetical protein
VSRGREHLGAVMGIGKGDAEGEFVRDHNPGSSYAADGRSRSEPQV